ncbi:hypothetical protein [Lihuaxuella thermophila]|uniref:hypothetical protein n=1 Tax=Lihuaxuella thermophila TaxID=1173111 RepID=UPI001113B2E8|nr:hypothetical protein [Lihuaxuella thermophila]
MVIGTARSRAVAVNETGNITFQIIETNVPVDFQPYSLTAELISGPTTNASVVGPVTFSGIAVA